MSLHRSFYTSPASSKLLIEYKMILLAVMASSVLLAQGSLTVTSQKDRHTVNVSSSEVVYESVNLTCEYQMNGHDIDNISTLKIHWTHNSTISQNIWTVLCENNNNVSKCNDSPVGDKRNRFASYGTSDIRKSHTLKVNFVTLNSNTLGLYICTVSIGEESQSVIFQIQLAENTFDIKSSDVRPLIGTDVNITCIYHLHTEQWLPDVNWYRINRTWSDGTPDRRKEVSTHIWSNNDNSVIVNENLYLARKVESRKHGLCLKNVSMHTNGSYACVVNDQISGVGYGVIEVIVRVPPNITLHMLNPRAEIFAGENVTFICSSEVHPFYEEGSMQIYYGTSTKLEGETNETENDNGTYTVVFKSTPTTMLEKDSGKNLTCSYLWENNTYKSGLTLDIWYPPKAIAIASDPKDFVTANKVFKIICTLTRGYPIPDVDVYTNGSKLLTEQTRTFHSGQEFDIIALKEHDGVQVYCNATGGGIKHGIYQTSNNITLNIAYPANEVIIDPTKDSLTEGDSTQLKCSASGGKPDFYTYTWTFIPKYDVDNNREMRDSQGLQLDDLTYSDVGTYICAASNVAGGSAASRTITLSYVPAIQPTYEENKIFVEMGKNINISMFFYSYPEPQDITCMGDGHAFKETHEKISVDYYYTGIELQTGVSSHVSYTCRVTNGIGSGAEIVYNIYPIDEASPDFSSVVTVVVSILSVLAGAAVIVIIFLILYRLKYIKLSLTKETKKNEEDVRQADVRGTIAPAARGDTLPYTAEYEDIDLENMNPHNQEIIDHSVCGVSESKTATYVNASFHVTGEHMLDNNIPTELVPTYINNKNVVREVEQCILCNDELHNNDLTEERNYGSLQERTPPTPAVYEQLK